MFKFLKKMFPIKTKEEINALKTRVNALESEIALLKLKK